MQKEPLFRTDGLRGVSNQYPMTPEIALQLGRALAYTFKNGHRHRKILIGKDTRLSGYMLETALASGITSMGLDVLLVGPLPTPGVAFLTQGMRASAGVMISASHNLFKDNGIKVFDAHGFKLAPHKEKELEELVFSNKLPALAAAAEDIGKAYRVDSASGRYIEFLKKTFPDHLTLDGIKIIIDCAHGAAYEIAPTVFEELGADVIPLNVEPNGKNINDQCGATAPHGMADSVKKAKADLGIALDGDADRVIFADQNGQIVDGDAILAVCAEDYLSQGRLLKKTLVSTVMSNQALENYLKERGGQVYRTDVGDRHIVEAMRTNGYFFGGEPSGHIVFQEYSTTGDGIIAALHVLGLMKRQSKSLSQLISNYHPMPQVLKNVRVKSKVDLEKIPSVQKMIHRVEEELGSQGRLLVRYSGTEPLLRIMIEGCDSHRIEEMAGRIASCVEENLS